MRKRAVAAFKKTRIYTTAASGAAAVFMVFFVPPLSYFTILLFASLLSFFGFTLASFFLAKRDAVLAGLFLFFLLALDALLGFNLLNAILLLSFVLGVRFLIQ